MSERLKPRELAKALGIQLWTPVHRKGKGVGMKQTDDGSYIEVGELSKAVASSQHPQVGGARFTLAQFKAALTNPELISEVADEWTEGEEGLHVSFVRDLLASVFGTIMLEALLGPAEHPLDPEGER